MDWLDLANPKHRFTASAKYYAEPLNDPSDGAEEFSYEYVDPLSHTYRRLFGNIQSTQGNGEVAIRTDDQLEFKQGGFIMTNDGKTFQIIQKQQDFQTANKQALRIFGVPVSVQYVIRMVEVPNPWGIV